MHLRHSRRMRVLAALLMAATALVGHAWVGTGAAQAPSFTSASVDVVVLDRDGRPVAGLGPADFSITVDGLPQRLVAVRHVSRGPGAATAASVQAGRAAITTEAAEPARTILIVVDQTMMERGEEPTVVRAVGALLDRLGLADLVAVVRLPTATATVTLNTDRPTAREELRRVTGQAAGSWTASADAASREQPTDPARNLDPDKVAAGEQLTTPPTPATPTPPDAAAAAQANDQAKTRDTIAGLRTLVKGLASINGRKVIVLFSAGLPPGWNDNVRDTDLRDVAASAIAARGVLHVIGLRSGRTEADRAPDRRPLETLAAMTGGTFAALDKQPDKTAERLIPSFASCYTLRFDVGQKLAPDRRHALRVEMATKGISARAPAWLVSSPEPEDTVVSLPSLGAASSAESVPVGPGSSGGKNATAAAKPTLDAAAASARDLDLTLIMSRLLDYVDGYQQAFSAVVAEERYEQRMPGATATVLRSDFLLVRAGNGGTWVSFRDVFERDGVAVRDREARLQKLFVENPNASESAQLQAIKSESARYNVGAVERTVNVPLYPFRFLSAENLGRLHFSLGRTGDTDNVQTRRVTFEERTKPTILRDLRTGADQPAKGYFVVDAYTGAITETQMEVSEGSNLLAQFRVTYRRDPALGLWVPAEMTENYQMGNGRTLLSGKATYTNFRRFRVTTEEKLTIRK